MLASARGLALVQMKRIVDGSSVIAITSFFPSWITSLPTLDRRIAEKQTSSQVPKISPPLHTEHINMDCPGERMTMGMQHIDRTRNTPPISFVTDKHFIYSNHSPKIKG